MQAFRIVAPLLLVLLPLVARPAAAAPRPEQPPDRLTFDDLFDDARTGRNPGQVEWRPDGGALTYVWDAGDGEALWSMDPASGEATRLVAASDLPSTSDDDEEADTSEADEAPDDEPEWPGAYHWSPAGDGMVIESGGDLLWLPLGGEGAATAVRLTATEAEEEAPAISPDGRRVAYVRDGDLYVLDLPGEAVPTAGERRLTTDGDPGHILNATTDWVYWEEIWGRDATGFWWSPDSKSIVYYRFDDSPVGEYTLLPSYEEPYHEPRVQRYPKAGTANPEVKLGVVSAVGAAGGETTWLDTAADEETYLARVHWVEGDAHGEGAAAPRVAVERLNREQTELDLLLCERDGACRVVLEERHPTWVNLGNETTFLSGGRFLWASERDGWRHLYLYRLASDGPAERVRQLTSGAWAVSAVSAVSAVTAVASVDGALEDRVLVTAFGNGALGAARRRLLSIALPDASGRGGGARELTAEAGAGWHEADPSPTGEYLVHAWSSADDPGWRRIERLSADGLGEATAELPSVPPAYDPATLPSWHFFEIPGGDGDGQALPAAMLLPPDVPAADSAGGGAKHAVIMYHYGGPTSQVVADRWASRGRGLWHKLMAQRGYGVLSVDNRASLFFGKAGEDLVHRRFGEVNLVAQKAGAVYLAGLPWVDASRIGLWGWSGGGSNTLYCLLNSPGTWRAGMAGAPVTDWRFYDTIWTERYLDSPEDNPDGYRDSSAMTYAEKLADELLIVHGMADDNVHPQSTMEIARHWIDADLPFEMQIYPEEKHGFRDGASRHFFERMTGFFERTLAADGAAARDGER